MDIDTAQRQVLFAQRWFYDWKVHTTPAAPPPWTYAEKYGFHKLVDRQIWGLWSNRIRLSVAGKGPLAVSLGAEVKLNFDVVWEIDRKRRHFTVEAYKMPPTATASTFRSSVNFASRLIKLNGADMVKRGARNDMNATSSTFYTIPHEFGHALAWGDEYKRASPHIADTLSIMNIGTQIRSRHLKYVLDELTAIETGTTFTVRAIQ